MSARMTPPPGAGTAARVPAEGQWGEEAEMVPRRPPSGVPPVRVSMPQSRLALTGALVAPAAAAAVANRPGAGPSTPAAVAGLAAALCAAGFLSLELRHRDGVERLELFGPVLLVAVFALPSRAVRADKQRLAGMQRATHALSVAIDPGGQGRSRGSRVQRPGRPPDRAGLRLRPGLPLRPPHARRVDAHPARPGSLRLKAGPAGR
jgi:hypothetical protein